MRAISLKMTAFGPYHHTQHINFEELGEETIFLITGPTGAGKTTIFDAICYALYGKASGSDRDQDSLRSHFANTDLPTEIEFIFAIRDKTYKVVRNPKQLKHKERGEGFTEDPARAELYDLTEDRLLSSKIKDVNEVLEEKLGLDYEQFRKMIMIPQGEFRRLISENSKEREEILQKIFRTYFYDRITEELKKQSKELRGWIEQLDWQMEQEASKIEWAEDEREEELGIEQTLEKLTLKIDNQQKQFIEQQEKLQMEKEKNTKAQEAFYEAKQRKAQFDEYEQVKQTEQELLQKKDEMERAKDKYNLALKADGLRVFEEQVEKRNQEWKEAAEKEKQQKEKQENLESQFLKMKEEYDKEEKNEAERNKLKEWVKEHQQYLPKVQAYAERMEQKQKLQERMKAEQLKRTEDQQEVQNVQFLIEKLEKQTEAHGEQTKRLYEVDAVYKSWLERITRLQELTREHGELVKLRRSFSSVKKEFESKQTEFQELKDRIKQEEMKQQHQLALSLALQLREGESCPVCGSTHHPAPANQSTAEHDTVTNELEKLIEKQDQLEKQLQAIQKEYVDAKSDGQAKRQIVEQYAKQLDLTLDEISKENLSQWLQQTGQEAEKEKKNYDNIQDSLKEIEKAKKERDDKQKVLQKLQQKIEEGQKEFDEMNRQIITMDTQIHTFEQDIPSAILDMSLSELEKKIHVEKSRYEQWLKHWEVTKQSYERIKDDRKQSEATLKQLQSFSEEAKKRYEEQLQTFQSKLQENRFNDRETYQNCLLAEGDKERLRDELETYETKKAHTKERKQVLEKLLKDQTYPDMDKLGQELAHQEELVEQYRVRIQEVQMYIKHHEAISNQIREFFAKQQNYAKQYYDIAELADLARGENHLKLSFERYVLSSFLDEILMQANLRLDQMTEHRYHLQRSGQVAKRGAQSGLDLEVMDHHTGQLRSVKTLSGGEGFKTALSLALGLADVVQAHAGGVQLDTLFIDEGFGTLDEVSLAQAIDCLKGLQQSNRVLGIISHVPQLKEEIHAKLQITTSPEGSKVEFQFH
ncbi:AAA family ATPase [Radiobacillus kanasensis]|uniref:SbcC/MukB-like Walker B domain-containing protein n=1 Tax=Radiobacillus kanasensis TaxID=2844358 RepID=UPI001E30C46F|nr:SbcC/MukB-like Walker B domain-containing protein [Radiobacillus kanasensis]UFU01242.1 AAA family ATPase [Radiobacillus kanasensis]